MVKRWVNISRSFIDTGRLDSKRTSKCKAQKPKGLASAQLPAVGVEWARSEKWGHLAGKKMDQNKMVSMIYEASIPYRKLQKHLKPFNYANKEKIVNQLGLQYSFPNIQSVNGPKDGKDDGS